MAGCSGSSPGDSKHALANDRHALRRSAWHCLASALCALLLCASRAHGADSPHGVDSQCDSWPQWQRFKQLYVSADGRVIDASSARQITVSEAQSYGLMFALIANDPATFARLLRWTQNNLARGDLTHTLPAWQWGRTDPGGWGVLDQNSAADSDLWIAYALIEAGALWHDASYSALGQSMAQRILAEEVVLIPGLGATLLPGPTGFVEHQTWRLNASYVPIQLLRAIARHSHEQVWEQVLLSSQKMILASAPHGAASDWIDYRVKDGFATDAQTRGIGSYDAIRVYLWAGMLPQSDPWSKPLTRQFAPVVTLASQRPAPPESFDTNTMSTQGDGSIGFSAALIPMLARARAADAVQRYRLRVTTGALQDDQHYFSDALSLFGAGWMDGRYQFDRSGDLKPQWTTPCDAR